MPIFSIGWCVQHRVTRDCSGSTVSSTQACEIPGLQARPYHDDELHVPKGLENGWKTPIVWTIPWHPWVHGWKNPEHWVSFMTYCMASFHLLLNGLEPNDTTRHYAYACMILHVYLMPSTGTPMQSKGVVKRNSNQSFLGACAFGATRI